MFKLFQILTFCVTGFISFSPTGTIPGIPEDFKTIEFKQPSFLEGDHKWADSIFDSLSTDERIAQLFMVAAYSDKEEENEKEVLSLIQDYKIGGLIFMKGGPLKQIELTNKYQSASKLPLMISIDGEWGLTMRLKDAFNFPKQMTLGAIQHDSLIYRMGKELGLHCKRMGIHVNFSPVVDVNNNPKNPVINYRSFGENRENVANKGIALMLGMQDQGILACGKHFPGHGDTDVDSHKALPIINHDVKRLDSIELYPFKKIINAGLGSMMVAHLYIPALDNQKNMATTLSKKVVTDLLRDSLNFNGLTFTDALNMKGVSSYYEPGVVDVKALLAGNDILLFSEDVPTAIKEIKKAINKGEITQQEIDSRCKKILYAKEWLKVSKEPITDKNLIKDLNPISSEVTNYLLYENALTLVKNKENLIPLKKLDTLKIASLVIGDKKYNTFQDKLSLYTKVEHFSIGKNPTSLEIEELKNKFKEYNLVIISIHDTKMIGNYGLNSSILKGIENIARDVKVVLNFPTNPYALNQFTNTKDIEAIIVSYEDNKYTQELVPELIFGGIGAKGKLPITANSTFIEGMGEETSIIRLRYTIPEILGIDRTKFVGIDTLVASSIKDGAFPGCQILIAKDGHVIYNESFGYHTYDNKNPVSKNDLYDLASVTKLAVSTPIVMKMHEEGILSINNMLNDYLPDIVDSTKYQNIVIKDMLAHQARFVPWIPFYVNTLKGGELNPRFYKSEKTTFYDTEVAENIYIFKNYRTAIFKSILDTALRKNKEYKYSDIGYYFLQEIIERKTNSTLDRVIDSMFFTSLSLQHTTYNPRTKFSLNQIIPTEDDKVFRKQLVHGYVHDQGAAMMGGVAGHAGLFSNANDMAILMQMLLNNGSYGGEKFLTDTTIKLFTTSNHLDINNRRGYGFDKPTPNLNGGPTCNLVSKESYGHSGFTGTRVWVDPKYKLIYIFLSNRVYPDAENWKIVNQDTRTKIEEIVYKSFL